MNAVAQSIPQNDAEQTIHNRLLDMAHKASECREERVAKSLTRIPPTLAGPVNTIAFVLLLLIFVYPFHHWVAGGVWNVSPQPFGG